MLFLSFSLGAQQHLRWLSQLGVHVYDMSSLFAGREINFSCGNPLRFMCVWGGVIVAAQSSFS
jgi:hypothetical protein